LAEEIDDIKYEFEYIKKYNTVYFNYSSCRNMLEKDVLTFSEELIMFIEENNIEKLVIDLRNNFGGDSTLLDPFIKYVSNNVGLNKKGNIFVIVGRDTFSSALLNAFSLKENTEALFIGEPTGGKPNCYGEVQRFSLKNSGLSITYSTEYYKLIEDDDRLSFEPDIIIDLSINNYINNEDPCLEYALSYGNKRTKGI
jgi:C-terminal processing protease CtpA/Prc